MTAKQKHISAREQTRRAQQQHRDTHKRREKSDPIGCLVEDLRRRRTTRVYPLEMPWQWWRDGTHY